MPIALEETLWMRVSRKTRTIETIAALIWIFHTLENTMQYHCPECKKAVNRDRIQTTPILLWAAYMIWVNDGPLPHPERRA